MKPACRIVLTTLIICHSVPVFSQDLKKVEDSTQHLTVHGKIQIANAGFAPVPAFSFNDPLATGFITLKKNRFFFDSDVALGFNGKPWMMNNWFRLKIVDRKNFWMKAGINPSLFFKEEVNDSGEEFIQAQRNFSFEFVSAYQVSEKWILSTSFLRNTACDVGALSGNFFDVSAEVSRVPLSKAFFLYAKGQFFYFDFGDFEGVFVSTMWRLHDSRIPVSIFFQGVLPLWASFPGNRFRWNTGVAYSF